MASPFASILHKETVQKLAGSRTYARGREYFEEGHVTSLTREKAAIAGIVMGESPYAVRVWVKGPSLAYSCTCPRGEDGDFCKHCVALSLSWLARASAGAAGGGMS
jgi:uncharacterized Zn finger protein